MHAIEYPTKNDDCRYPSDSVSIPNPVCFTCTSHTPHGVVGRECAMVSVRTKPPFVVRQPHSMQQCPETQEMAM
jgi:hypothetical protein